MKNEIILMKNKIEKSKTGTFLYLMFTNYLIKNTTKNIIYNWKEIIWHESDGKNNQYAYQSLKASLTTAEFQNLFPTKNK